MMLRGKRQGLYNFRVGYSSAAKAIPHNSMHDFYLLHLQFETFITNFCSQIGKLRLTARACAAIFSREQFCNRLLNTAQLRLQAFSPALNRNRSSSFGRSLLVRASPLTI